ncbi:MAG: outer membrane protein assembly factor BamD [Thermoanaerobaculia bacterium]|nr:outer membrane protein assembly factor BamD [Thermoanaerobaculia bacterium]
MSSPRISPVLLATLLLVGLSSGVVAPASYAQSARATADPAAARLYEAAQQRLRTDAQAAAEELNLLVRQFPGDVLAPKALSDLARLRIAQRDEAAAEAVLDQLLADYPRSTEAASGFVMQAELAAERAQSLEDLGEARTAYQRVVLLFGQDTYPRLEGRSLARVRSAELGLLLGDVEGAVAELVQAIEDEPPSRVTGRARLVLGRAFLLQGRWTPAMEVLQTLADDVPRDADGAILRGTDSPTASAADRAEAGNLLTLAHRHELRPLAGQRRWVSTDRLGTELNLEEPIGVAADGSGQILVVDKDAERVSLFRPENRTWEGRSLKDPVRPVFAGDAALVVSEEGVSLPFDGQRTTFLEPVAGKEKTLDRLLGAVRGRQGVFFVAAKGWDGLLVYPTPRRGSSILATNRAEYVDLDRDELGRVLTLDARNNRILRVGLDGRSAEVVASGDWKKPVAVARDALDHVYVLDQGNRQVFVYDRDLRRIASLGPSLGAGIELRSPQDVAVDGSGRILIADAKHPYLIALD